MQSTATSPEAYIAELPNDRKEAFQKLRQVLLENLPAGFEETMSYGMIGYVVPHTLYPAGYHCTPALPLPFLSIASQKNFIAVYHMGISASPALLEWFEEEYPKHSSRKLDMGKSCIRFKNAAELPLELLGELATKMTPQEWITLYEQQVKR